MNKKLLLLVLLFISPFIANAEDNNNIEIMTPQALNIPPALKLELAQRKHQQETKGYYETDSEYATYLLNLKKVAPMEIKSYQFAPNPYDTHLKTDFKEIKLAFPFHQLKWIDEKNIIGYAAAGTYLRSNDKAHEGWTGIGVFFSDKNLGECVYTYFNLKLSNGGVNLNKDFTSFKVNKKATTESVEGNSRQGFVHTVSWYTRETMSELECANKKFDKQIMPKMMTLADKIDSE